MKTVGDLIIEKLRFEAAYVKEIESDMKKVYKTLKTKSFFSKEAEEAFELLDHHANYGVDSRHDDYWIEVESTLPGVSSADLEDINKIKVEDGKMIFEMYSYHGRSGPHRNWLSALKDIDTKAGTGKRIKSLNNSTIDTNMELYIKDDFGLHPVLDIKSNISDVVNKGHVAIISLYAEVPDPEDLFNEEDDEV